MTYKKYNFRSCLEERLLEKINPSLDLAEQEMQEAESDFKEARHELERKAWKWATDMAYYAMYHAAKALLYVKGYRERRSHRCVIEALKTLYMETGEIDGKYIEYINSAKFRRETGTYQLQYSEDIAKTYVMHAEKFLEKAKELLKAGHPSSSPPLPP